MSEVIDEIKNLNEKLDKTLLAAHEAQKANEEMKDSFTATNSTVQKAVEEATKAMESAQESKQKLDAIEQTQKYIEKMVARMGSNSSGSSENDELAKKAGEAMASYLRSGNAIDPAISEEVVRSLCSKSFHGINEHRRESEIKTLIAGNNPAGGYFIRPDRSAKMIKRIFESSPIRSYASIETTASDTLEILIDDDEAATGGWVGEMTTRSTTGTPRIGLLTIPVHEQYAQPKATQKMIDDPGFDIESWLQGKVTRKMTRTENSAFVLGDGSQKPKGFLQYPAWAVNGTYERKAIEQINSGTSGQFTADGLKELQNSLIEEYQAGAIFGMKRASFQQVITLKSTATGDYLLDPRSMKVGDTLTLLGKPVVFMNDMPSVAANALAAVYGDFSVGYTIVDRIGFRVIRDDVTEKGSILYYTTKRTGGDVTSYESLKIQKLA